MTSALQRPPARVEGGGADGGTGAPAPLRPSTPPPPPTMGFISFTAPSPTQTTPGPTAAATTSVGLGTAGCSNEIQMTDECAVVQGYQLPSGHHEKVWSLAWNPYPFNGAQHMLASSGDTTVVWKCQDSNWTQFTELKNKGKGSIRCCAWRLDGRAIATGSADAGVTIWEYNEDIASFEISEHIPVPSQQIVKCLSWNLYGTLLSLTNDGCISIIGQNKEKKYQVKCRANVSDIAETSCITWHPEGKYFAVGGYGCIKIMKAYQNNDEMEVKEILNILEVCEGSISGICYSCEGTVIASAGQDGSILFWKVYREDPDTDETLVYCHIGSRGARPKTQMSFDWSRCKNSAMGYLFASGSLDHELSLYFVQKKADVKSIVHVPVVSKIVDAHGGSISDLKWHYKEPGLLASASLDGSVKVWRIEGKVDAWYDLDDVTAAAHHKSSRARPKKTYGPVAKYLKRYNE